MERKERLLAIDDVREHGFAHVLCRTYRDGESALLNMGPFTAIYLDHDLGVIEAQYTESGKELTGYDICLILEQRPDLRPEEVFLVTGNPVGLQRMQECLQRFYNQSSVFGRVFSNPKKE